MACTAFRAVLWDFGGVLTTSPFEAFNRFERERGLPHDFIRRINTINPDANAWAQFESSRISLDEFDAAFAAEARAHGYDVRGREVVALLAGDLRPRMVAALVECKRHFKVACLTNNVKSGDGPGMAATAARVGEWRRVMDLFDLVLESSREGVRKPQPRFYEIACERLGVNPKEVVFLDDLGVNLKPARAMGMTTIKVVDEAVAIAALEETLGITVPAL